MTECIEKDRVPIPCRFITLENHPESVNVLQVMYDFVKYSAPEWQLTGPSAGVMTLQLHGVDPYHTVVLSDGPESIEQHFSLQGQIHSGESRVSIYGGLHKSPREVESTALQIAEKFIFNANLSAELVAAGQPSAFPEKASARSSKRKRTTAEKLRLEMADVAAYEPRGPLPDPAP